jgi:competence ComEA-like helix-hairpin-helix protein
MYKKIKVWGKRYFGFSPSESRGFFIMLFLLPFFIFSPMLLQSFLWFEHQEQDNYTQQVDSITNLIASKITKREVNTTEQVKTEIQYFSFNPNTVTIENLIKLGFKPKISQRIVKYRESGGEYYNMSDLEKIYGIDKAHLQKISQFINFPKKRIKKVIKPKTESPIPATIKAKMDINHADTVFLKSVNGIGSVLSNRIIKFRDKLGGFVSMDQLNEIYGLEMEVVEALSQQVFISESFQPEYLNINLATEKELASHPYISRKTAKTIVNYRNTNGVFANVRSLSNIHGLSLEDFEKIKPYLTI